MFTRCYERKVDFESSGMMIDKKILGIAQLEELQRVESIIKQLDLIKYECPIPLEQITIMSKVANSFERMSSVGAM